MGAQCCTLQVVILYYSSKLIVSIHYASQHHSVQKKSLLLWWKGILTDEKFTFDYLEKLEFEALDNSWAETWRKEAFLLPTEGVTDNTPRINDHSQAILAVAVAK